jgi:TatD DNase family protein
MIPLFDAHNHLQDEWLTPHRGEVIAAVERAGVRRMVVNGTMEADWAGVASLASRHPWVLPSYGLHPWQIARRTPSWRGRLESYLDAGGCGVGEIGLDRWMKGLDFEDQKKVFIEQLGMATARNLPVSIHCLQAWGALHGILREQPRPARGFLLHSYGGPGEMVDAFAGLGAYFSFSGYFLGERKSERREVFRRIPLDRLLAETDAPAMPLPAERVEYPLPESPEGKPVNHPANIGAVYKGLAEVRGISPEELAARARENFMRLFGNCTV